MRIHGEAIRTPFDLRTIELLAEHVAPALRY
jgi:hypothetical protein